MTAPRRPIRCESSCLVVPCVPCGRPYTAEECADAVKKWGRVPGRGYHFGQHRIEAITKSAHSRVVKIHGKEIAVTFSSRLEN